MTILTLPEAVQQYLATFLSSNDFDLLKHSDPCFHFLRKTPDQLSENFRNSPFYKKGARKIVLLLEMEFITNPQWEAVAKNGVLRVVNMCLTQNVLRRETNEALRPASFKAYGKPRIQALFKQFGDPEKIRSYVRTGLLIKTSKESGSDLWVSNRAGFLPEFVERSFNFPPIEKLSMDIIDPNDGSWCTIL